jgi:hypothetical protein
MPIIHIAPENTAYPLTLAYPPMPILGDVLTAWQAPLWDTKMHVYPAGYIGNITPPRWREYANYLLHVDDSGEQAHLASGVILPDGVDEEAMLRDIGAEVAANQLSALGEVTVINAEVQTSCIAAEFAAGTISLAGLVMYARPERVAELTSVFPQVPLQG